MGEMARALWGRWPERYGEGGQSAMGKVARALWGEVARVMWGKGPERYGEGGQSAMGGGGQSAMGEVARVLWGRWPERYGEVARALWGEVARALWGEVARVLGGGGQGEVARMLSESSTCMMDSSEANESRSLPMSTESAPSSKTEQRQSP